MSSPRFYQPTDITSGKTLTLDERAAKHATRVLRLRPGDDITLFNGEGGEYAATIVQTDRNSTRVNVTAHHTIERSSALSIVLAQAVCRGERMDFAIQKAVELGASSIVPVLTERCVVQLNGSRVAQRMTHWHGVIVSACEQCGNNRLPLLQPVKTLETWLEEEHHGLGILLDPRADAVLSSLTPPPAGISLLIGPEGGLSAIEIQRAQASGFSAVRLGPRILRTETAGVAVIAATQALWGDFASHDQKNKAPAWQP